MLLRKTSKNLPSGDVAGLPESTLIHESINKISEDSALAIGCPELCGEAAAPFCVMLNGMRGFRSSFPV